MAYISLVRSKLIYSGQLWNPYLIKDIVMLERIQHVLPIKFILNDYTSSNKSCLQKLNILSLMHQFDYYDILFFVKHIKHPMATDSFNILNYVSFSHGSTKSFHNELQQKYSSSNSLSNLYFCHLPKIWNSLPPIDLNQPFTTIILCITKTLQDHFIANFDSDNSCIFHYVCLCSNGYCNSLVSY